MKKLLVIVASASLLLVAQGAFAQAKFGADRHIAKGLQCESCHGPGKKIEEPGLEQCAKCHEPKALAEKTKNAKPRNPHNSPHYNLTLECNFCHLQHEKPVNFCAQCHSFEFRVP